MSHDAQDADDDRGRFVNGRTISWRRAWRGNERVSAVPRADRAPTSPRTRTTRADSTGSSCYNCHMPYTTYGLLKTIRSHPISSPSVKASVETGRPNACNLCHLDKTLAWTADALARWYGTPAVALERGRAERGGVAAVAAQRRRRPARHRRAGDGWPPAQQASGTDWMAPYLAQLLDDPYDAVRFGAARSMTTLPGFGASSFDFVSPAAERRQAQLRTMATWDRARRRPGRTESELLMTAAGEVDIPRVLALLKQRNNSANAAGTRVRIQIQNSDCRLGSQGTLHSELNLKSLRRSRYCCCCAELSLTVTTPVASRDIHGTNGSASPAIARRAGPTLTPTASSLLTALLPLKTPRVGGTSA